jgi:hypothetical protein
LVADERGAEVAVERDLQLATLDRQDAVANPREQLAARGAPDVFGLVRHDAYGDARPGVVGGRQSVVKRSIFGRLFVVSSAGRRLAK